MLSFWRGNTANVLRVAPNIVLRSLFYDNFKALTMPEGPTAYSV